MARAWITTCVLALAAAAAARAQGIRPVSVPRKYGLDLASASPKIPDASDVTFDGDSIHARGGVARLQPSETAFEPSVTTSATALPLEAGAGYLVNDRSRKTWVLRVASFDGTRVRVTVAPSAATLRWQQPAPPARPAAPSAD